MEVVGSMNWFGKGKAKEQERCEIKKQTDQSVAQIKHRVHVTATNSLHSINRVNRSIKQNHFTIKIHVAAGGRNGS